MTESFPNMTMTSGRSSQSRGEVSYERKFSATKERPNDGTYGTRWPFILPVESLAC